MLCNKCMIHVNVKFVSLFLEFSTLCHLKFYTMNDLHFMKTVSLLPAMGQDNSDVCQAP